MPSSVVGGVAFRNAARNCRPCVAVVGPGAGGLDELAGRDQGGVADDRDEVALAARLDPQHAEAVVGVVEGDALDEPGEVVRAGLAILGGENRHVPSVARAAKGGEGMFDEPTTARGGLLEADVQWLFMTDPHASILDPGSTERLAWRGARR